MPFQLIWRIENGLPFKSVDKVAHLLAPHDTQVQIPPYFQGDPRSSADSKPILGREGARLARLANVWSVARDVWGGDEEAREFLFRPHPMAEDKRPIDLVIQSEFGADLIIDILGGLKYGSAA